MKRTILGEQNLSCFVEELTEKYFQKVKSKKQPASELPCSTRSLCPVCLKIIKAELYEQNNLVFMNKSCDEHGIFNELISSDAVFFKKLRRTHYEFPRSIENPQCTSTSGCPHDCGLCDQHLSSPLMLNIDLTNRCNLNCPICFANSNATGSVYEITLDQLDRMLDKIMQIQPTSPWCVQFVGGEPTIHKDFIEAIKRLKTKGISQVQVASNGLKFAQSLEFAQAAGDAGLQEVYLQFDGLNDDIYRKSRGRSLLDVKLQAIENIQKANIRTILVPTLVKGLNDDQVGAITQFAMENTDAISAISWQPVAITGRIDALQRLEMRYTTADLAKGLQEQCGFMDMYRDWYPFSIVEPFIRLMEVTTHTPQMHCTPHAHCGCATYLIVDKVRKTAVPLPAFIDVEPAMKMLNKMAARIEKYAWSKNLTTLQAMHKLKKYFKQDKAPEGWDFDDFLAFVKDLSSNEKWAADNASYMQKVKSERFGILLMASMHFQDNYNYELDRTRNCVIFYVAPNGRFYPFCTWNSGPCHRYGIEHAYTNASFSN